MILDVPPAESSTGGRLVLTEEEEIKEATRIANSFVAGVMAAAVADYIKVVYEDNHDSVRHVTLAQVSDP